MRYYLDTEFDGFGGRLISLALVRQDGDSIYFARQLPSYNEPWVKTNVAPILNDCPKQPLAVHFDEWGKHIGIFLGADKSPEIITDWPDDIRYLCETLIISPGMMVSTGDITFHMKRVDAYPTELKGAVQHNAWWDAMALRELLEPKPSPQLESPDLAVFGWAPGGYTFRCVDCSPEENERLQLERWAAKRAWRCKPHAQRRLDAWYGRNRESAPAAGAPKSTVEG